jgi:RNA polymerase sigma-70 factor (ECF subfamily)
MSNADTTRDDDRRLMFRLAQGDVDAFKQLYETFFPCVAAFLARSGSPNLDDLTQEVFVRLWERRRRFQGRSSAKTYLIGIAQNVLRESQRQSIRWPMSCDNGLLDHVPSAADQPDPELPEIIDQAKASLSPNQLQAIELVYHCRIKPADAAALAGCSYKAMCRRLEAARARLRQILERHLQP